MTFLSNPKLPLAFIAFLSATIFLRQIGFSLITEVAMDIHNLALFVLALLTGGYFYYKKHLSRRDMLVVLGTSLSTFLLLRDTFVLGTLTIFLIFLINSTGKYQESSKLKTRVNAFAVFTVVVSTLLLALSLLFGDFDGTAKVYTLASPNGSYQLAIEKIDLGATGGATEVTVKRAFGEHVQWKRTLYSGRWSAEPSVQWIDNHTAKISRTELNIFWRSMRDY